MTKRHRRPLFLLTAAALVFGTAGYAATGGVPGPNSAPGRASVDPPPNSKGHCGHTDQKPPCKHYKG